MSILIRPNRADADPLLRPERPPVQARVRLVVEVLVTYVHVRRLLRRHDLLEVVAALRATGEDRLDIPTARWLGRRINRIVEQTLAPMPSDSRCLTRSLVVLAMLEHRGVRCQLLIGARGGSQFAAHAWLEHQGWPILSPHGYQPLTSL